MLQGLPMMLNLVADGVGGCSRMVGGIVKVAGRIGGKMAKRVSVIYGNYVNHPWYVLFHCPSILLLL
jgi:hypothetical protein